MAVIHDVIPAFELFQPTNLDDALALVDQYGRRALVLAGGIDALDWMKDRLKRPEAVVDLGGIEALKGVREVTGGIEIGAMTTLTELARHPLVRERYPLLARAATAAASPQIRNQSTAGGNICQDTRCWYYRDGWPCYRAGGNICYADTPTAVNREHAIFGADRCVAVNPSDTAPAYVALEAQMVIRSRRGERLVDAEEFFIGPGVDITRMTTLRPGELLTAMRVPRTWAGAEWYFEKVADRRVWDFPLVNIAAVFATEGGTIARSRIVLNAVAARPWRLRAVEEAIRGKRREEATAVLAGDLATRGAQPLRHNGYKVSLVRNLVKRAVRGEGGEAWTS